MTGTLFQYTADPKDVQKVFNILIKALDGLNRLPVIVATSILLASQFKGSPLTIEECEHITQDLGDFMAARFAVSSGVMH